jgi:hypothetical protein
MIARAGCASAPYQHHTASSGALAISLCVLRASTCVLFGRSLTCRPLHLQGRRAPTTGLALYATVLPAILQYFLCIFSSSVPGVMRDLASAQPLASSPHPVRSPGRTPHASAPAHARTARSPHGSRNAARRGARVVDPTRYQLVPPPPPHDAIHRTCPSKRLCVSVPQTAS